MLSSSVATLYNTDRQAGTQCKYVTSAVFSYDFLVTQITFLKRDFIIVMHLSRFEQYDEISP